MAITTTGSFLTANSTTVSTINVTVANVGDLCVMFIANVPSTIAPNGMSGTNSMGAFTMVGPIGNSTIGAQAALFYAKAGATGTSTLTATFNSAIGSNARQFDGWMFTAGLGALTVWTIDDVNTTSNGSSTTVTYPTLNADGLGELYAGCALCQAQGLTGSTSGFTYSIDPNFTNVFAHNGNASGTLSPTATQTPSASAASAAILMTATLPTNPPYESQYLGFF
jgi:hypothetical protein